MDSPFPSLEGVDVVVIRRARSPWLIVVVAILAGSMLAWREILGLLVPSSAGNLSSFSSAGPRGSRTHLALFHQRTPPQQQEEETRSTSNSFSDLQTASADSLPRRPPNDTTIIIINNNTNEEKKKSNHHNLPSDKNKKKHGLSPRNREIRWGDLPGYTGWARLPYTLAEHFHLDPGQTFQASVGQPWNFTVTCRHPEGQWGGAIFYLRAYGPALLTGPVHDAHNGSYTFTLQPWDAGQYVVEVVLTFSNPVSVDRLPLARPLLQPAYEGFLIPGSPFSLRVVDPEDEDDDPNASSGDTAELNLDNSTEMNPIPREAGAPAPSAVVGAPAILARWKRAADEEEEDATDQPASSSRRLCRMADMLEPHYGGAVTRGRWVVREKVIQQPFVDAEAWVTLEGYHYGLNALGIRMGYVSSQGCSLMTQEQLLGRAPWLQAASKNYPRKFTADMKHIAKYFHVVFIGDSNLRILRADFFQWYMEGRIRSSFISTRYGIIQTLDSVKEELSRLLAMEHADKMDFFIVFNTGLHDISMLCDCAFEETRLSYLPHSIASNFSCIQQYEESLEQLVKVVIEFPAVLRVWQTTSAAWPKWGVFGGAWPPGTPQVLPKSPHVVDEFNRVAWRMMTRYNISVVDAYWMTLARPDHRQVDESNNLTDHLVHAGPEVYSVLSRQLAMMVLETMSMREYLSTGW